VTAAGEIDRVAEGLLRALRAAGALDDATERRARRVAEETGERIDRVLARLGLAGERALAEALAACLGLDLVRPEDFPDTPDLAEALGAAFAASARVAPLDDDGETVRLAMADPLDGAVADLAAMKLGRRIVRCVAAPADVENALERLRADGASAIETLAAAAGGADDETAGDLARLRDMASEAPVVRLVNLLIRRAAELGASDIHLEPFERRLRLRYRVDGALREADAPPAHLRAAVVSRIKIMARLDIAESRLPQDGRIKATVLGRPLDMRVATTPTLHGEGVVIRLLDRSGLRLDYDGLGIDAKAQAALIPLTERPNGVLLVTGPTGSGKTTTLYATVMRLNAPERKIVTVEDPVEYQLDGVNQIQVHGGIGLGFADALRSILRQDPDVIMIGEIRDAETARIAVQAALTGHLVLATLHANGAAASVSRLRDMGVPGYLIAATVVGAAAQRLVRRLCPDCAAPDPDPGALLAALGSAEMPGAFRRPVGCPACGGVGYRGRTTVLEVMAVDDAARRSILSQADDRALEAAAVSAGMRTLRAHGLARAAAGETSLAEVARVAAGL
jgi:general secretion pathway protein E